MDTPALAPTLSHPLPSEPGTPFWPVTHCSSHRKGNGRKPNTWQYKSEAGDLWNLRTAKSRCFPCRVLLHQRIVGYLYLPLESLHRGHAFRQVFFAPLSHPPVARQVPRSGYCLSQAGPHFRSASRRPEGTNLVMEVVSDDEEDRQRDLKTKRQEYAQAGIAEYWLVDPKTETVVVLMLDGAAYRLHGEFPLGTTATSVLLPAFAVDVAAVFDAGRGTRSENG